VQTLDGRDPERICHYITEVSHRSRFLRWSFQISPRKDKLIDVVRESLVESPWYSWSSELDSWPDEKKFQALDVLVAIIRPKNLGSDTGFQLAPAEAVAPQHEIFSPENQGFLMQLRTRFDSVLHTYLLKIADTTQKRNYLHAVYTAGMDNAHFGCSLDDMIITQILELHPPTFQPCTNLIFLFGTRRHQWNVVMYLKDLLWDPERSKLFYYDRGLWSAVVAARYMRYVRTTPRLSLKYVRTTRLK